MQNLKLKCSVKSGQIVREQTAQGVCSMNERQPNSQEHEDCLEWQRRKTRLLWLMRPSTQFIGKDIRASSLLFTRRAGDVVSEAFFTTFTGDRHDGLTVMDLSMIPVALTPSWLVWNLTVVPVWLYFSSFLFFILFWTQNFIYYTSVNCVWFLLPYIGLQSNWVRKPSKLGLFIFRLCLRCNNVNYGVWHAYKPLFGSSVATCQLVCSEISLSINENNQERSPRNGRT